MSTLTPNYGLTKPAGTENYSVAIFNANADIVDTELKTVADTAAAATAALDTEFSKPHHATLIASSAQSIPDASSTKIAFPALPHSLFGLTYDSAQYSLTVTKAGVYLILGSVGWTGNANGARYCSIDFNNQTDTIMVGQSEGETGAFNTTQAHVLYQLDVGDSIRLYTTQFSGGALNTSASSKRTQLSMLWVSDIP